MDDGERLIWTGAGIVAALGAVVGFFVAGIGGALLYAVLAPILVAVGVLAWVVFLDFIFGEESREMWMWALIWCGAGAFLVAVIALWNVPS